MTDQRSAASVRELTTEEERELAMERTRRWLVNSNDVPPFTPEEARYHARRFIESNSKNNLVRLLAEAYLRETM